MKFNTDRKWLERRAEQEDRHFISVGGLISTVGLKVMDGGGFAASLDEFSKAWAIYFPDVVSSKSKKALTKM